MSVDSGFHTDRFRILDSRFQNSILDSGFISWIPDYKAVDSGFHRPKLPGFRIPLHAAMCHLCMFTSVLPSAFSTVTVSTLPVIMTFSKSTAAKNTFSCSLSKP